MIFSIFIYLISGLINFICAILPAANLYPDQVLDAFVYFGQCIMKINFILPAYEFLTVVIFLIQFEATFFVVKIIAIMINTLRGANVVDY